MPRIGLRLGLVVLLVLVAGCVSSDQGTTEPTVATATPTTTSTMQKTTATTTKPTTVVNADRVPFSLRNRDSTSHGVTLVIQTGSSEVYNDSITLEPGESMHILMFRGQGSTYHVRATTDNATFETNVTLTSGLIQSGIAVNESGQFEYRHVVN